MQINTGKIAQLELELGETVNICFHPKVGDSQANLGILIGTREFLDGEMSLTVIMPSESTYESDYTDDDGNYLRHLITSNPEEGKQFCGVEYPDSYSQDGGIGNILVSALKRIRAQMSEENNRMEALISLNLSELKWLESWLRSLRQSFLRWKGPLSPVFTMEERILGGVLFAFSKKYLDQQNGEEPSFLTLDVE